MRPQPSPSISLTAIVAGQTYDLNDRSGIFLEAYDLGLASTDRLSQRAPGQLGVTDLGGLTNARFIDLAWRIQGNGLDHYHQLRELFMDVFRNHEEAVVLTFDFGHGRIRSTDVHLDGLLDFRDRAHTQEVISGIFKASDPRLYDPALKTAEFSLLDTTGGLPIPWTIPIPIGQDAFSVTIEIFYAGGDRLASAEFPIIIVNGPITNPIVKNKTTNEQIALTANGGLSLGVGEFVKIDLSGVPRRDSKTLRDQNGNGVSQFLSTDSDLSTWHLAHNGEKLHDGTYADGTNIISVGGSNVTLLTSAELRYYHRYEGA